MLIGSFVVIRIIQASTSAAYTQPSLSTPLESAFTGEQSGCGPPRRSFGFGSARTLTTTDSCSAIARGPDYAENGSSGPA